MLTAQLATRTLPDGRRLDLVPQLFGAFKLCLNDRGEQSSYADVW